jgi:hypothetical protein
MDSSRPYRVSSPDAFEMLVFAVPKVLLRPHVDVVGARTACAIPARAGLAALVAPFLRSVGDGLLDGTVSEDDADLGEGVVDLVRGLFARRGTGPRGDLLADAKATIELRLHDADLGPATVAAAHFISTRYLHRLFEPEGVTVSEPLGSAQPRALQPALPRRLRDVAQRCARACKRSSLRWQTRGSLRRTVVA